MPNHTHANAPATEAATPPAPTSLRETPAPTPRVPTVKPHTFLRSGHKRIRVQLPPLYITQPVPRVLSLSPPQPAPVPRVQVEALEQAQPSTPGGCNPALVPAPTPLLHRHKLRKRDFSKFFAQFQAIPKAMGRKQPALIAPDLPAPWSFLVVAPTPKSIGQQHEERPRRSPWNPQTAIVTAKQPPTINPAPLATPIFSSGDSVP